MGTGFKHGAGGGNPLNFKVVGNPQPANLKENTIWVDTDEKITGYIFSAAQPTGSAGMVWITTAASSTVAFNALKKNGIQVYPISAKQYISGKWVYKTAKSYQGGAWVDWLQFKNIELTTDVWTATKYGQSGSTSASGTVSNGKITLTVSASTASYGADAWAYTKEKMDMSKVKTIEFTVSLSATSFYSAVVGVSSGTGDTPTYLAQKSISKKTGTQTISLDVSSVNTTGYIHIVLHNNAGSYAACTLTVSSVRIETA